MQTPYKVDKKKKKCKLPSSEPLGPCLALGDEDLAMTEGKLEQATQKGCLGGTPRGATCAHKHAI